VSRHQSQANIAEAALDESLLRQRKARPADFGLFLMKFLAKGRTISSAVPSSRSLVEGVLRLVDFDRPSTIVELGAGTGPVTEQILDRIGPQHRFVAVENDPDFCQVLRRRFPETPLLEMDASRVGEPLARMGINKVDYVLSGLPTPSLPKRSQINLWRWLRSALGQNGLFIQITVAPLYFKPFYDRLFERVEYRMVWRNIPPGGVYYCSRPRPVLHLAK
jgi:phospholipid N-methyltransferase